MFRDKIFRRSTLYLSRSVHEIKFTQYSHIIHITCIISLIRGVIVFILVRHCSVVIVSVYRPILAVSIAGAGPLPGRRGRLPPLFPPLQRVIRIERRSRHAIAHCRYRRRGDLFSALKRHMQFLVYAQPGMYLDMFLRLV